MNNTGKYILNKKNIISIYFTAEYPSKVCTKEIILSLQNSGADLIEIGIPFSDPLADGPVIQNSRSYALQNGFNIEYLFNDLKSIKPKIKIPLILMGYFNTMLAYGIERFLEQCKTIGIDTVILPDLPPDIYCKNYSNVFEQYGVSPVFLITPQTSTERIKYINSISNAFVYAVADNSITGSDKDFTEKQLLYFKKIKQTSFSAPVLIGFGISDNKAFHRACEYAHGAIIGSAFIRHIERSKNINESIKNFISNIKFGTI